MNIPSLFIKQIIARIISKIIKKQYDIDVYIDILELSIESDKDNSIIKFNGDATLSNNSIRKLVSEF